MNNTNSYLINPGKLELRFGKEIPVKKVDELSESELKQFTRNKILKLIDI